MLPPNTICPTCGCNPNEVALSLEVARLYLNLVKENERLRARLNCPLTQDDKEEKGAAG